MEAEEEKKSKKIILPIVGVIVLFIAAFFAWKKISYARHNEDTENSQIEANIIPIAPRISGYVDQIYVVENQKVKKGDTLVRLDDRDLKIKLEQAEINLKNAQANVGVVKSNVSSANASATATGSNIETAKANIEAAKVRLWNANENFKRYEKLLAESSATQQQYDAAYTEKQGAEKQLALAEAQLKVAEEQTAASQTQASGTSTQVNLAETGIQQRLADIDYAKLQLSYAYIIAPADGYVSKKNVQPGQLVNTGQTLMSIVDESSLWVTANFKETQIEHMKVGQEVEVKVDAYPGKTFKGKIESLQAATGSKFSLLPADNSTGNFVKVVQRIPVRIQIQDDKQDEYALRAGMNVTVAVKVK